MARNNNMVLLGFIDEVISEKHKSALNLTVNKIGGTPNYPDGVDIPNPICPLCQLPQLLVVQLYAPLDSRHHRTLYLFGCPSPPCWNQSKSWTCIRIHAEHQDVEIEAISPETKTTVWCEDANDWDDNFNERNGNAANVERISDGDGDDGESCGSEDGCSHLLGARFDDLNLLDNCNANTERSLGAAAVDENSTTVTAEIEGDEGEIISIDTPTVPQRNLASILSEHNHAPIARGPTANLQFDSFFISVWEESDSSCFNFISDNHIRELLEEYQQEESAVTGMRVDDQDEFREDVSSASMEQYEKSEPMHGDKMYHNFIMRIQLNPGQVIRYGRGGGGAPLLLNAIKAVPTCGYCNGDTDFEFQLLPTLISKLKVSQQVEMDESNLIRVEYGNVLVFSCKASCWESQHLFKQEIVIVQKEHF